MERNLVPEPLGVIVGGGARCAVGTTSAMSARSIFSGISRIEIHPFLLDKLGQSMVVARAKYLPVAMPLEERMVSLLVPAIEEALLGISNTELKSLPLFLGLPNCLFGLTDHLELYLSHQLREKKETSRVTTISFFSMGNTSGIHALNAALNFVENHPNQFCLFGGVDSYLSAPLLDFYDYQDRLFSEQNPWGIVPGEAAGICLLAGKADARSDLNAIPLAISGVGLASEVAPRGHDSICLGKGLGLAWQRAIANFPSRNELVFQSVCDLNGSRYRVDEFGFAMASLGSIFQNPLSFLTPSDCWGDIGAASIPCFLNLILHKASQKGKDLHYLIWASNEWSEDRGALIASSYSE